MAGITFGGLSTGLDTNSIISQLVALERQPIALLNTQLSAVQATQASLGTLGSKLTALKTTADALKTSGDFLVRKATSSNESIATAAAGSGAAAGSVSVTVAHVARGSVASSTVGVGSADATIASGVGFFKFKVGSGDEQSVALTGASTLQDLVNGINDLGAGVTASAVNLGTAASPDYRLQLTSNATGDSSTITVTQDNTDLAVAVSQTGLNAEFTIAGFTGTFERESNTFSDVLTGVTFSLKSAGSATITVTDDANAIVKNVQALVTAFNDAVKFVSDQSTVTPTPDGTDVTVGTLANSSTARRLVDELHATFSEALTGATTQYVNLSSLGLATQADGTIKFDESAFRTALTTNPTAVAQVFAGNGTGAGVATDLSTLVTNATGASGAIAIGTNALNNDVQTLQDQIDGADRAAQQFETGLRAQFTALETLVGSLQSQSSFLTQAFGTTPTK
jgi:flagellar hook-associated protein 2